MSTDIQRKGDSYRRQLKLSEDFAEKHGLEMVETLEDIGVSAFKGKNSKEGALGRFLDAVESGQIAQGSYLLVESLDRVSRESVINAFNLFSRILQNGVVIVTLADNQIYNLETLEKNPGQIFMTIGIMLRANDESKMKSDRLNAVWQHKKVNAGTKKVSAMCPAWLTLDKQKNEFVVDQAKARAIKKIFEMSVEGYGAGAIVHALNQNPKLYPPNNKSTGWYVSYVKKILVSPTVYGEYQPHSYQGSKRVRNGDAVPGYYPEIVSKEVFDLSRARMKQRKVAGPRRKGRGFSNLFTRLIVCAGCGTLAVFRDCGDRGKGGKYLQCGNAQRRLTCKAPPWEYLDFETSFFSFIRELDLESIFLNDGLETARRASREAIDLLEEKLNQLEEGYTQMLDLMGRVSEDVMEDVAQRLTQRKIDITATKAALAQAVQEASLLTQRVPSRDIKANLEAYEEIIKNKTSDEQREIRHKIYNQLRQLITSIQFRNLDHFEPGEDIEDLDQEFIDEIKRRRYKTRDQQLEYLLTAAGQRTYTQYHRQFVVVFKNGVTKYVQPWKGIVLDFKSGVRRLPKR